MDAIINFLYSFWYSFQDAETILQIKRIIEIQKDLLSSAYLSAYSKFVILLDLITTELFRAHFIPFAIIALIFMFIFMTKKDNELKEN